MLINIDDVKSLVTIIKITNARDLSRKILFEMEKAPINARGWPTLSSSIHYGKLKVTGYSFRSKIRPYILYNVEQLLVNVTRFPRKQAIKNRQDVAITFSQNKEHLGKQLWSDLSK
jgi:hypothetical protein